MRHDEKHHHRNTFAVTAVAFEGGLAVVAIAIGWIVGFSPLSKLPGNDVPQLVWQAGLGALATGPMFAGLWAVERIRWRPLERLGDAVDRLLAPLVAGCSVADLAMISLMAGIGEEVLFRGLIQDGAAHWIGPPYGVWISLAIASIVFGFAHAITRMYIALAALAGLYLGLLFIFTDSLLSPIIAHAAYDFGALWYLSRRSKRIPWE